MNLAVITPAYYPNREPFSRLEKSCAFHHLPLMPFGIGEPWHGDLHAHFTGAAEMLHSIPSIYDLVMFTDAEDTFVMGGADEIEAKWRALGGGIVLSAEQGLYPWGMEKIWEAGDHPPANPPWQYPNGGGWIGQREPLLQLLNDIRTLGAGDEAQSRWINAYCSNRRITLDEGCQIFQTMSGDTGSNVDWAHGRLINLVKDSRPVVVHFNGKLGGIEQFWEKAYGRR